MGITITEYAKRAGISRQAAHKRLAAGKIRQLPDGSIDEAAAAAEWEDNKDVLQEQRGAKFTRGKRRDTYDRTHNRTDDEDDYRPHRRRDDGPTFADLQKAEKALKVKRDQLKLQREQGKLIEVEEARRAWADMISTARGALLPIAGELADTLAAEPDAIRVRELIDRRIHQALSHLAEYDPKPE